MRKPKHTKLMIGAMQPSKKQDDQITGESSSDEMAKKYENVPKNQMIKPIVLSQKM